MAISQFFGKILEKKNNKELMMDTKGSHVYRVRLQRE